MGGAGRDLLWFVQNDTLGYELEAWMGYVMLM
jgi:hypothetical protein